MADPGQLILQPRRDRARRACTECQRRHQRCDGEQPCGQCYRRFPEPECIYESRTDSSRSGTSSPGFMLADPGRRAGSQSHRSADAATPELDCAEAVQAAPAFDLLSRAAAEVDDVFIDAVVVQLNMLDARRRSGDQRASGGIDQLEGLLQESGLSRKLLMIFGSIYHQQINLLETNINLDPAKCQFRSHFVPLCLESPLLSQISIYMAARYLAEKKGLAAGILFEIRGVAFRMLLEAVSSPASDETVAAVIHFINNDLCYNETEHAQNAHLPGMRNAIIARGGIRNLGMNGILAKLAITTDLLAAVTLESDHVLTSAPSYSGAQSEAGSSVGDHFLFIDPLPRPVASMVSHNTPLLSPMTPFETCTGVLGISHATASILRDIRLLIDKVLALPTHGQLATRPAQGHVTGHRRTASSATAPPPRSGVAMSEAEMRVRETASWLQGNISEFAVRDRAAARRQWDPLHVAVLHAALLTTRAVAARRPVSQVDPTMPVAADERSTGVPGDTLSIWGHICQVPLERWRRIPGILLWIGVTAAPLKDASLPAPVQQLTSGTSPLARTATPSSSSSSAASPANLPYPSSPSPAFDCGILGARALVHVAALQIATEDWAVAEGTLRRAAALSAWLRGGAGLGHQHETTVTPAQPPASSAPAAAELGRPVIGSSNDIHRQERAAKRVNLGRGGGR